MIANRHSTSARDIASAFLAGSALLATLFLSIPQPARAATEAHGEEVNLPLADYLDLVRRAREAEGTKPPGAVDSTLLAAQRISVRLEGPAGNIARLESRFEIDARGEGKAPIALPIGGRIESVRTEARTSAKLYRTTGGLLAFVPAAAGRYVVTVASRVDRGDQNTTETFSIPTRAGAAPISEVRLDLPAEIAWELPGAVKLEDRIEAGRRRVLLAPATGVDTAGDLSVRTAAAPSMATATAVARSVVITHLDLRADEVLRLDTILVEVLRGELASLEARLPAGLVVERAWMDDGTEVSVGGAAGTRTLVTGKRKQRLAGSGFLKILSRRNGPPPAELAFGTVEPSVAVRARYLVVSSSVVATLTPVPEASWSTIDLTDPPDSLEAEFAERPPVGGWRLEAPASTGSPAGQPGQPALRIGLLPAVDRTPLPIANRWTETYVNPDGSLLVQDRFYLVDHRDALELTLPEGMRFESATVDGDVVRPIERDGKHLLPLRYRGEGPTSVEISLSDRSLVAAKRAARRRFALPQLEAGPGGEVLQQSWKLYLPPGIAARYIGGSLRPVPKIKVMPLGARKKDGRADSEDGYYDFDAYEEMEARPEGALTVTAETPLLDEKRIDTGSTVSASDLEKIPTGRDPWKTLQNAPSVMTDRINVGGNEGSQSSFIGSGTVIQVRPSFQPAPGSSELRLTGALPPRQVTAEIEVKEAKKGKR